MRVIFCLVAFIAVVNAGIIGDSLSDSALLSIIQQIGLVEGHSAGGSTIQTIRIIQEHQDAAPAEQDLAEAAHEDEAQAEVAAEDAAPGPGHSENDYILKAVLAAKHAAAIKRR